ncbi:MAG: hypothetical protein ACO3JL_11045 [Myxococcota bacterium]
MSMLVTACVTGGVADGGPYRCEGTGDVRIAAGHTSVGFEPIADGDELPAWLRPQGGIGTRINVRLEGFSDEAVFTSLRTRFLGLDPGDECATEPEICGIRGSCEDGQCRTLLADQTNARFPIECQPDGSLLVAEMPVRFRNQFELDELDGVAQQLEVTLVPTEGNPISVSVPVVLRVGEFLQPSWWEEGSP